MFKERLKIQITIVIILMVAISAIFTIYQLPLKRDLKVKNNIIRGIRFNRKYKPPKQTEYLRKDVPSITIKNITFLYNNYPIIFKYDIFQKAQRYYLPLENMACFFDAGYYENELEIQISYDERNYIIDKKNLSISVDMKEFSKLRGEVIKKEHITYLSLSDIEAVFGLSDRWDYNKNQISFYKCKPIEPKNMRNGSGTAALIRLEDVGAGEIMRSSESMEKMKIIADYLYSENIKYSIAWIPRYKDPEKQVDNNLMENYSIENAHFINMLDYLILRGAVVGLHGYTHQHDNEKSIINVELSEKYNNDINSTSSIIEAAIQTALTLNIPISFFETPHYVGTKLQQSVIEYYFDYIYEPFVGLWNKEPILSPRNGSTIYIPTPLGYLIEDDPASLIGSLKEKPEKILASFFYHPSKEFNFINLNTLGYNYINYEYSNESPMHKLVKTLNENGYITIDITQIK